MALPPETNAQATPSEWDSEYFEYFYDEPGSEPGTLSIEADATPTQLVLIDYNRLRATRRVNLPPHKCLYYLDKDQDSVLWLDVQGLGNETALRQVGDAFELHPLLLEDVVNVPQRPKVEEQERQLLLVTQMVLPQADEAGFRTTQVSLVLGSQYLLTFQQDPAHNRFDPVRERLRRNRGQVRHLGADYLAYLLLDAVVDAFFPVLEDYGERIDALEDAVVRNPSGQTLEEIYAVRRELLALRRLIWPQRNLIDTLMRGGNEFVSAEVEVYLRDCYDHTMQLLDVVENYRELTSSLTEVYLSAVNNRMNEVMKLLTAISTIFIPLTFVAGVYGMNFEHMPELEWRWGYFGTLGVMAAIALGLVWFFWRRGWFQRQTF